MNTVTAQASKIEKLGIKPRYATLISNVKDAAKNIGYARDIIYSHDSKFLFDKYYKLFDTLTCEISEVGALLERLGHRVEKDLGFVAIGGLDAGYWEHKRK